MAPVQRNGDFTSCRVGKWCQAPPDLPTPMRDRIGWMDLTWLILNTVAWGFR